MIWLDADLIINISQLPLTDTFFSLRSRFGFLYSRSIDSFGLRNGLFFSNLLLNNLFLGDLFDELFPNKAKGRREFEAQSCAIPRQTLVWGKGAAVQEQRAGGKILGLVVAGWELERNG